MTISLHDDVFAAHADEMLIFLDLARDRYCALNRDWSRRAMEAHATGRADSNIVGRLRQARLSDEAAHAPFRLTEHPCPKTDLASCEARAGPISIVRAALCRMHAARLLRRRHIAEIVGARRANRKCWRGFAAPPEDLIEQARRFSAASLFAPRAGACLEHALALLLFLGRAGAGADWVFAVKAAPFSAHCWIEHERVVLNDSLENTARYTPIMVV